MITTRAPDGANKKRRHLGSCCYISILTVNVDKNNLTKNIILIFSEMWRVEAGRENFLCRSLYWGGKHIKVFFLLQLQLQPRFHCMLCFCIFRLLITVIMEKGEEESVAKTMTIKVEQNQEENEYLFIYGNFMPYGEKHLSSFISPDPFNTV